MLGVSPYTEERGNNSFFGTTATINHTLCVDCLTAMFRTAAAQGRPTPPCPVCRQECVRRLRSVRGWSAPLRRMDWRTRPPNRSAYKGCAYTAACPTAAAHAPEQPCGPAFGVSLHERTHDRALPWSWRGSRLDPRFQHPRRVCHRTPAYLGLCLCHRTPVGLCLFPASHAVKCRSIERPSLTPVLAECA